MRNSHRKKRKKKEKTRLNEEYATKFPSHFIQPLYSSNTANLCDIDFDAVENISIHSPESTDK